MRKASSNNAARAPARCTFTFRNHLVVGGTPIEMYGDSWFVHFQVVIIIVLHIVDTEPLTLSTLFTQHHPMPHSIRLQSVNKVRW